MKHKLSLILAGVCILAGCVFRFAMPGHDFIGYLLWLLAVLIFAFPRLSKTWRIVQEDQSTSTRENLENSFAIIRSRGGDPADGVAVVSSEYHLYRAKQMARALGAKPLGVAAETTLPTMRANYFIREAFAAAYMQVFGVLY